MSDRSELSYLIAKPFFPENVKATVVQILSAPNRRLNLSGDSPPITAISPVSDDMKVPAKGVTVSADLTGDNGAPVVINNREELTLYSDHIISVLDEVVAYDKAKQHNQAPPDLWRDDDRYLSEVQEIVAKLREIKHQLTKPSASPPEVDQAIIDFRTHINTFLENYSATLGKGAGYGTVLLIVGLLSFAGLGGRAMAHLIALLRAAD